MKPDHKQIKLLEDMHILLVKRTHAVIADVADTCVRGDVSQDDTLKLVISALLYEVTSAAVVLDVNEKQFMTICRLAWQTLQPEIIKRYEEDTP
jgi:hypothetical protein